MPKVTITRKKFLQDKQGRTFADVAEDHAIPFDDVLDFFNDEDRQRRMEDAELHHNRPPLAGLVRELEARPEFDRYFSGIHAARTQRLRQAIGVVVRMIMEFRGWKKTGKKGSLGVRAEGSLDTPARNSGGLSLWFVRAERYQPPTAHPYRSVEDRYQELETKRGKKVPSPKRVTNTK